MRTLVFPVAGQSLFWRTQRSQHQEAPRYRDLSFPWRSVTGKGTR